MSAAQAPLWGDPDPGTVATLDTVDGDWRREADRQTIDDAVRAVAAANDGVVSTNALRAELTTRYGVGYVVSPQAIGPRLAALTRAGVLEVIGWETSTDAAGGNAGKPIKLRCWVGAA